MNRTRWIIWFVSWEAFFYLLICFYFNVYHKCISSSLKNFWHSSKRPVFDCTHCTNTEQHCTCSVQYYWHELYTTKHHCTYHLTRTVPHWTALYVGTDLHFTALANTVKGPDLYCAALDNTVWALIFTLHGFLFFWIYEVSWIMSPIE